MTDASQRTLALYHSPSCGFCWMVQRVIGELGIDVELRNVDQQGEHRADLLAARGRGTVPVLRILDGDRDEWMPESLDIVQWLRHEYA